MTTLVRWEPFREIAQMQSEVGRLFEGLFDGRGRGSQPWVPALDVWETDNEVVYAFDLPGLTEDEISIEVADDTLTVTGERRRENEEKGDRFFRYERRYGSFSRVIPLPPGAISGALGVGNPVRAAKLRPGEVVLDLGCGGGIDTLLAARAVAPGGRAIGLDMLAEMLEVAARNAAEANLTNVEWLRGDLEDIPLPDASVDVALSNGVVNLSPRKSRVFAEVHRVLRPGGRLVVADLVVDDDLPPEVITNPAAWPG